MCVCVCVCLYAPHLYAFICWWAFRLLPCLSYCKQCCSENWGACILLNHGFLWIYTPMSGIARSYGTLFLAFLRNPDTVLHSGCTMPCWIGKMHYFLSVTQNPILNSIISLASLQTKTYVSIFTHISMQIYLILPYV